MNKKFVTIIKKAYAVDSFKIDDAYIRSCISNNRYYGKTPAVAIKDFIDDNCDWDIQFNECSTKRTPQDDFIVYDDGNIRLEGYYRDVEEKLMKQERIQKIKDCPDDTMFCVQDARQYNGNAIVFWKKNRCGYTTNVNDILILSKKEILQECWRETDHFWRLEDVLKSVCTYCNSESLFKYDKF